MIGNDIIDLKQAAIDSNWKHPRFLDKVFTEKEQELIFSSENKHQVVWLLWSMKEAAYKIYVQQFSERFFNPKRLECKIISFEKGRVSIDNETYFTASEITKDYIYTVATLDMGLSYKSERLITKNLDYKSQSTTIKASFLKSISEVKGLNIGTLKIEKSKFGVPQLFHNSEQLSTSFSLTHCGYFCSYVYY